jgi:hypothetical protein
LQQLLEVVEVLLLLSSSPYLPLLLCLHLLIQMAAVVLKVEEEEKVEVEALAAVLMVGGEHLEDSQQWHRIQLAQTRRAAGFDHHECSLLYVPSFDRCYLS